MLDDQPGQRRVDLRVAILPGTYGEEAMIRVLDSTRFLLDLDNLNMDPALLGFRLDREYGICCRVGLHCAPEAHGSIGTLPEGTVRLSPGYFNTADDIEQALFAIRSIIASEN